MDKHLKITVMLVSLMVGFSVFYYFVIYLPGLENKKEARKAQAKLKYERCISSAQMNYDANWAAACESTASANQENLRVCLSTFSTGSDALMYQNICRQRFLTDPSPNCTLPKGRAESIDQTHKEEQDKCLTEARSEL